MIVFDSDDFGANHVISDMCQSHDCRDVLDRLHIINPAFKATLFAIPGEMTWELIEWCAANSSWIELAYHGIFHSSNYECEKMKYEEFSKYMSIFDIAYGTCFAGGFKAPGWQISDACFEWLYDHGWWVADQPYNNERRPKGLPVYIIGENPEITSIHTHTWNCVGNGVYELEPQLIEEIKDETEFRFVSEVVNGNS